MEINLAEMAEKNVYALLTQTIIPRPIAWVLTANKSESDTPSWNLAPFSFFNGLSSKPPMLMFSVGSWDVSGRVKDTLMNLRENPFCTVGIASSSQAAQVQATAQELPYGSSEISEFNIPTTDWDWSTPRLTENKINFACKFSEEIKVKNSSQILVLCEISKIWVDDSAVSKDEKDRLFISPTVVDPLLRLGAGKYGTCGSVMDAIKN